MKVCSAAQTYFPHGDVASAAASQVLKGDRLYTRGDEAWRLCFMQGRGFSFLPSRVVQEEGRQATAPANAAASPPPSRADPVAASVADASDARYRVALEMAQTEETYGAAMALVVSTLIAPLREAEILPERTIAKIFSSTERIASLSAELQALLHARLASWDGASTCVGDVFTELIDSTEGVVGASRFAAAYMQYVNNFDQSSRALRGAEDVVEWVFFQKHWRLLTRAQGGGQHSLPDLLIQPVQRIPVKHTHPIPHGRSR